MIFQPEFFQAFQQNQVPASGSNRLERICRSSDIFEFRRFSLFDSRSTHQTTCRLPGGFA
ncbi:MAG: hypothetical protein AMJ54_12820 [Deltaproteobacteria bacterium SG8_13]|nr:MAG: hypothetical protein AMJ54_12820 [Deltaproteobacteria bacterium SG8_13]